MRIIFLAVNAYSAYSSHDIGMKRNKAKALAPGMTKNFTHDQKCYINIYPSN